MDHLDECLVCGCGLDDGAVLCSRRCLRVAVRELEVLSARRRQLQHRPDHDRTALNRLLHGDGATSAVRDDLVERINDLMAAVMATEHVPPARDTSAAGT